MYEIIVFQLTSCDYFCSMIVELQMAFEHREERIDMSENKQTYRRLDLEKLQSRITKVITTEEALKDVVPMEWPEEVLSGKKKVIITRRK